MSPRPLRQNDRNPAVVAFVLHQFPIGHMPVAASRPARHWSTPPGGNDPAVRTRFPPRDHPRSELVEDTDALARVRSGEARVVAEGSRGRPPEGRKEIPEDLVADHDPLGELGEIEWERRYVARAGSEDESREYVWPASAGLPEGGPEPAAAIVLDPDTVVDHLGDGEGRVLAAAGTAFAHRSLPGEYLDRDYRRYRLMRPLPVWSTVAVPWFAQPGGGLRYRATCPVTELVAMGYLVELTDVPDAGECDTPEARTMRIGDERTGDGGTGPGAGDGVPARAEQEAR